MRALRCHGWLGGLLVLLLIIPLASPAAIVMRTSYRDTTVQIPIKDDSGKDWFLQGHLCSPLEGSKHRLVLINHGSPPSAADRPDMRLASCDSEAVQWFLRRHYAVALILRLGYGATGGPWTEGYHDCEKADYYQAGLETARQLKVIVDALVTLPQIEPDGVIVVGQSAGGWGTLAYDSLSHPHVAAFVNMAGGRGGHYRNQPHNNCHPERLIAAAARFGKTASTPMLWIYTQNDSYFEPRLAAAMNQAFSQAGGKAEFVAADSFGSDGHHLFFGSGGSNEWGPLLEAFLKNVDATAGAAH